jgi:excisionase family DNA binding protein
MVGGDRLLSVGDAAEFLGVSVSALRRWSDQGLVPVHRTPGGQRRYALADLRRFIESMREPGTAPGAADAPRRARRSGSA